ncbi:hypothetical protein HMPREF9062_1207 [Actinomyces sp. oral taxon 448 str. F0400]|nr:hypothetical protein HMPREF9062_1207 [Actinomyces sp. oral taxon 448 str. F0400]
MKRLQQRMMFIRPPTRTVAPQRLSGHVTRVIMSTGIPTGPSFASMRPTNEAESTP